MAVARSRTFRSGNSEALRLPKDVAFGDDVELVLVRSGNVMTIYPAATSIIETKTNIDEKLTLHTPHTDQFFGYSTKLLR